jgi:hypothetical protein
MCIDYLLDEAHREIANNVKFFYSNAEKSFEVEVHMPRKDDAHFNEFAFKNSLEATIDKEKIENLYEKGAIGFLATEENLEDEEFMNYIKELMVRFPEIIIKPLCFSYAQRLIIKHIFVSELDRIKILNIKNIYMLANEIEVYICNMMYSFDVSIYLILRANCPGIFCKYNNLETKNFKNITVAEYESTISSALERLLKEKDKMGFNHDDISDDKSFSKIFQKTVSKRFALGKPELEDDVKAYEYFNFQVIEYALSSNAFKRFYFEMILGQLKILYGNDKK